MRNEAAGYDNTAQGEGKFMGCFDIFRRLMREQDIRRGLHEKLTREYTHDPGVLILDELGICGGMARVDIAVINGELKGFEIKSERDTLDRLAAQSLLYGRVFDTMSIVVAPKHVGAVLGRVPDWWDISIAHPDDAGSLLVEQVRIGEVNTGQDPVAVVQLLWRDEVLALLRQFGLARGLRKSARKELWETLALSFELRQIRSMVRDCLKARKNWRAAGRRRKDDEKSRPSSRLLDCQCSPRVWHTCLCRSRPN